MLANEKPSCSLLVSPRGWVSNFVEDVECGGLDPSLQISPCSFSRSGAFDIIGSRCTSATEPPLIVGRGHYTWPFSCLSSLQVVSQALLSEQTQPSLVLTSLLPDLSSVFIDSQWHGLLCPWPWRDKIPRLPYIPFTWELHLGVLGTLVHCVSVVIAISLTLSFW